MQTRNNRRFVVKKNKNTPLSIHPRPCSISAHIIRHTTAGAHSGTPNTLRIRPRRLPPVTPNLHTPAQQQPARSPVGSRSQDHPDAPPCYRHRPGCRTPSSGPLARARRTHCENLFPFSPGPHAKRPFLPCAAFDCEPRATTAFARTLVLLVTLVAILRLCVRRISVLGSRMYAIFCAKV